MLPLLRFFTSTHCISTSSKGSLTRNAQHFRRTLGREFSYSLCPWYSSSGQSLTIGQPLLSKIWLTTWAMSRYQVRHYFWILKIRCWEVDVCEWLPAASMRYKIIKIIFEPYLISPLLLSLMSISLWHHHCFLGTGVPLSIFCHSYYSCLFFILFLNPSICFFGAINKARIEYKKENSPTIDVFITNLVKFYKTHLLHPDDWFSLWRLNCRLVSYHSHITKAKGYLQEVQYCISSYLKVSYLI